MNPIGTNTKLTTFDDPTVTFDSAVVPFDGTSENNILQEDLTYSVEQPFNAHHIPMVYDDLNQFVPNIPLDIPFKQ